MILDTDALSAARQHALPVLSNDRHFDAVEGVSRIAF